MLFGMDRDQMTMEKAMTDKAEHPVEEAAEQNVAEKRDQLKQDKSKKEMEEKTYADIIDEDNPVHFTQKTASVLEAGIKGFYEAIVKILYSIAEIFF